MRYPLHPVWFVVLYSIAGYTAEEVASIGGWSLEAVTAGLETWQIPPSEETPKGRDIRAYIDKIRVRQGDDAARRRKSPRGDRGTALAARRMTPHR